MRPIYGLFFFILINICLGEPNSTVIGDESKKSCSLYCFITPERNDKVNFTIYHNLSCTHFVYGFGELTSDLQFHGPSTQDEGTHSYPGNFHYLRTLKERNPSSKILLGIHLDHRDSLISSPPSRLNMTSSLINILTDLHLDGLFLRVDRPFTDNSRFSYFFKDLSAKSKSQIALGIPLNLVSHSLNHLLEAEPFVSTIHLLSNPSLHKISQLDPLLSTSTTPPEQTISYHAQTLASKGVPKRKIIIGLSTASIVYKNYLMDSIHEEAEGHLLPLSQTCNIIGDRRIDEATGSEMIKSSNTWISSTPPNEQGIGRKVRWLTSSGFGGVGLQSISYDDINGDCGKGSFPLLNMAKDNLECTDKIDNVKGCTRMCYINSPTPLSRLQPNDCSHIVVEATLSALGEVKLTSDGEAIAKWLRNWRVANKPRLLISLGSKQTSDIWRLATHLAYTRNSIISQLRSLITEWKGNGVEISWTLGSLDFPTDSSNLAALLTQMRTTFGNTYRIIFAATHVSAYQKRYQSIPLNTTVDWVVLHSHRFHSSRQPFTGHHSPLLYSSEILPDQRLTIEGFVGEMVTEGIPRSKIIVGATAEPMSMSLMVEDSRSSDKGPFGLIASPSINLITDRSSNDKINSMKKVCDVEKLNTTRKEFITDIGIPFLIANNKEFVAYENERSMQMKTTWMSLNQLGGMALFDIQLDNPDGTCPSTAFPLLNAIKTTQVCEECVGMDDITPCDTTFSTSCSYRLPTASEKNPLPTSKIPFGSCSQIVVEEVLLKEDGNIHFRDDHAEKTMTKLGLQQPKVGMKRLITSIRCDMSQEIFNDYLKNGPKMAKTLLSFINKYSFSGIELKCDHLIGKEQKESYSSLLNGLRVLLIESTPPMKCPHTLSIRVPIWTKPLSDSYDISILNSLQHIVLEPFNDPPRENTTHINSPLFSSNGHYLDIDTTIKSWTKSGLENNKIILQIPSYATIQENASSNISAIGISAKNGRVIDQAQVCHYLRSKGTTSTMMWDRIATYAITEDREWISMQDQATIAYKIFYSIREGLGGIGLLSLNEDDWDNKCASGAFPLLTAAKARCLSHM